jgi:hypothetical protein
MRSFKDPVRNCTKESIWLGGRPDTSGAAVASVCSGNIREELVALDDCGSGGDLDFVPVKPLKTPASPPAVRPSGDWASSSAEGDIGTKSSEAGWPKETNRESISASMLVPRSRTG